VSGTVSPDWNTHGECGWCKGVAGEAPNCWCTRCHGDFVVARTPSEHSFMDSMLFNHMFLCPDCGNKRCPRATFHGHDCTGSNAPGQAGSSYAATRVGVLPVEDDEQQLGWRTW
jgi:hypothetical protein